MRKVVLTVCAVLVVAAFTLSGCKCGESKTTTGTKTTATKAPAQK